MLNALLLLYRNLRTRFSSIQCMFHPTLHALALISELVDQLPPIVEKMEVFSFIHPKCIEFADTHPLLKVDHNVLHCTAHIVPLPSGPSPYWWRLSKSAPPFVWDGWKQRRPPTRLTYYNYNSPTVPYTATPHICVITASISLHCDCVKQINTSPWSPRVELFRRRSLPYSWRVAALGAWHHLQSWI